MARTLVENITNKETAALLNKLLDTSLESREYADTLNQLGEVFGHLILERVSESFKKISVACTVEDADNLSKGIIDTLEKNGRQVLLTVFWNKRIKPNKENNISVAPILRSFHEPGYKEPRILIVIKSIIANSCVVRTNLTNLVQAFEPDRIFVVAPVLLSGAIKNLQSEFDDHISRKFEFLYFAEDDEKSDDGMVIPGVGGDVYKRLGFDGQDGKNRFTPAIVRERRYKHS